MKNEHRRTHKKEFPHIPAVASRKILPLGEKKLLIRIPAVIECVRDISLRNDMTRGQRTSRNGILAPSGGNYKIYSRVSLTLVLKEQPRYVSRH